MSEEQQIAALIKTLRDALLLINNRAATGQPMSQEFLVGVTGAALEKYEQEASQ